MVSKYTWCLTSTETIRLIRDREKAGSGGGGVWRWRKREIIYLSLHCQHQNDFCIKTGSDESHFNVSVGSDGQSHKTVSINHNLFEEKREPKQYRTEVLGIYLYISLSLYIYIVSFTTPLLILPWIMLIANETTITDTHTHTKKPN